MNSFNKIWKKHLQEIEFDTSNLEIKDHLHPEFWKNGHLDTIIRERLLEIADDIFTNLDLPTDIVDILLTGSIAGFNWHTLSDIDLHILLDFREIDENFDLVKDLLDAKRIQWNKSHKILISGHEVEIYFQDTSEEHETLSLFSLRDDKWLKDPVKEDPKFDLPGIKNKADAIAREIDHALGLYGDEKFKESHDYSSKLKEKVKRLRHSGLERDGVYSTENLAFKLLRNNGFLEKLMILKNNSYDKMMSISSAGTLKINIRENWDNFLNS